MLGALKLTERASSGDCSSEAVSSWIAGLGITEQRFLEYLDCLGMTIEEFGKTIMSEEPLPFDHPWLKSLNDIYKMEKFFDYEGFSFNYGPEVLDRPLFPSFFAPYLNYCSKELEDLILSSFVDVHRLLNSISASLYSQLLDLALPTLIELFHTTSQDRSDFDKSFECLHGHENFARRYPALSRCLSESVDVFILNTKEMLSSLLRDESDLYSKGILISPVESLESVSLKLGDFHNGNKSVQALYFPNQVIYYRPRPSEEFEFYNRLVSALGLEEHLPTLVFLNRDSCCWVLEYTVAKVSDVGLADHLLRMGILSAVLYMCGSKDMHMENVIATSFGPVPIDLETILAPTFHQLCDDATSVCKDFLNNSPLGTGILPVGSHLSGDIEVEVSALIGGLSNVTAYYPSIFDPFGDKINFKKQSGLFQTSKNLPVGATEEEVSKLLDICFEGFMYGLEVIRNSESVIRNLASSFEHLSVRVLYRPTSIYDLALKTLRHPKFGSSMLARERFLMRFWADSELSRGLPSELIFDETIQMMKGDVPYYRVGAFSNTQKLKSNSTFEFIHSPVERMETQLNNILWFKNNAWDVVLVRESLSCASNLPRMLTSDKKQNWDFDKVMLERLAEETFQRFIQNSILGESDATWVGFCTEKSNESIRLAPLGNSFYDGLAGIALALASFYRLSRDEAAKVLSIRALVPITKDLSKLTNVDGIPIGAYSGISGMLYSLHVCQNLLQISDYDENLAAKNWIPKLSELIENDRYVDVSSGAAGLLHVICSFVESGLWSSNEAIPLIVSVQDRLIKRAIQPAGMFGYGWETGDDKLLLGGFSHGAIGIYCALARSYQVTSNEELLEFIKHGASFDDNYLSPSGLTWRDMRKDSRDFELYPNHWCHGAPGILMAKSLISRYTNNAVLFEQMEDQLENSSLPENDPFNHSLCHGGLGNALCFSSLNSNVFEEVFKRTISQILDNKFVPGLDLNVDTVPGLLLGHAGLLYSICYYLEPSIPNILSLEGMR